MNQEFTKIKSENVTRYILENGSGGATSGGTSSASVGGGSYAMPIGGIQRRKPGQNLISQEAKEKEAPKPRNFVAKNAKMGGAGQHRDKKKEIKQGVEKHKKPYAEDVTASSISSPHGPAAVAGAQRGGFAGLDAEMGDKADKETLAAYQIKIMNKQAELEIAKKLGGVPPKFGKDGTGIFSGMNALEFPKWLDAHPQYVDAILGITGTATPNKSQNRRSQTVNVPPVPTAGQTSMTDYKSTSEGHDDNGGEEYNDEVGMADSNIHTIIRSAKELINALEPMENMPEWAQDKLAQVKGMLVSVKDYVESQHEQGNIYHTNEGLGDEFSQFLKDKGIKHRVAGSPEQERQRTQDMMAQRAKDRANAPAPAAPSPEAIAQAKEKLAMLSKQFDPNYQYSDDHSFWTKQHQLAQQIDSLKKFISRGEVGVAEAFSQAAADKNKIKYQKAGRIGHGVGWKEYGDDYSSLVSDIVNKFDNITRLVQYDQAEESTKYKIVERFFKKYGYPFELFNDVITAIERRVAGETNRYNEQGLAEGDGDEAYVACIVQFNRSGRAMVQRTKPISHERAEEVIRNALAKNTFVHPPFMTIYPASAGKLDGSTIMAQFPDMSQKGVAEVQLTPLWQDDPEHLEYRKKQADISRNTGLAVGDLVTLKDKPGFEGKIVRDWGGGDFTISGSGGGMSQSNNHRANARNIQKLQGVAEAGYGNHPSQRVDPRTGKKYVPPKSPLGQGVAEAVANPFALARSMKNKGYKSHKPNVGEDAYIESLFAQLEERAKK